MQLTIIPEAVVREGADELTLRGPRKENPNEIPSKVGFLGNPFEEPDGRIGKSLGRP